MIPREHTGTKSHLPSSHPSKFCVENIGHVKGCPGDFAVRTAYWRKRVDAGSCGKVDAVGI